MFLFLHILGMNHQLDEVKYHRRDYSEGHYLSWYCHNPLSADEV